jgi:predicted porin
MRQSVKVVVALAVALAVMTPGAARAVEIKAGSWDISLGGNVNAFATYSRCGTSNASVAGGLACSKADGSVDQFSIESGLLPSAFVFGAKTRAYDKIDTSATLGIYPGLHVSSTRTGVANNGVSADVRQLFVTFGDKSWGTVKLGKDLGLFGSDVILSDMLLLGVGAGTRSTINTTLGHIGTGYLYADWIPQVAYTTPSFGGLAVTVAIVEGFGTAAFGMVQDDPATPEVEQDPMSVLNDTPGVQARVSYDFGGAAPGRAWLGGMYQNAKLDAAPENPDLTSVAGEVGAKVNVSGLGALAYGYVGDGVGAAVLGLGATPGSVTDGEVDTRKSYGFFGQLTYQIPGTKLKPGVSYGKSFLDRASGETSDTLLKSNEMVTAALFYGVTDSLTLTAEFDHLRSNNQAGGLAKSNSVALGGIIFF